VFVRWGASRGAVLAAQGYYKGSTGFSHTSTFEHRVQGLGFRVSVSHTGTFEHPVRYQFSWLGRGRNARF